MTQAKYDEIADQWNFPKTLRIYHSHAMKMNSFLLSLYKRNWRKKMISAFLLSKSFQEPAIVKIKDDGITIKYPAVLNIIATECFERGVDYIREELLNAKKSEEIFTGLRPEHDKNLREFFRTRIELLEKNLLDRPVANVKYSHTDFEAVDNLVAKGFKQSAALDDISTQGHFNRESFEKQYRTRWLNKKVKKKP